MSEPIPSVTRAELAPGAVILDVREDEEWRAGHIPGAIGVPAGSVVARMTYDPGELLSDEPLVVVCKGGGDRSGQVTAWLNANGFDALRLTGGVRGWKADGRPLVSETGDEPFVR